VYQTLKVAAVIPCYRVTAHALDLVARIPQEVDCIYCIDDACPDGSGKLISTHIADPRVRVITHVRNLGVGGAVKTGYRAARADGCDVAVKLDGDGQMNPRLLPAFLHPIALGRADYTKGNRFYRMGDVRAMPGPRLFGNALLSFFAKFSTGYWNIFDPTNGYTALHLSLLELVPLDRVADRYFFETDLLFRLNVARAVVRDVPMEAVYGTETSSLSIQHVILPFLTGHLRNFFKRVFYTYFLRDFHVASLQLLLGPCLLASGLVFGLHHWDISALTDTPATAGTVMIAALQIILGLQLWLAALSFDVSNVPAEAVHPLLVLTADDVRTQPPPPQNVAQKSEIFAADAACQHSDVDSGRS
jgi:dolichol-phosphate mannosyltransferase